MISGEGSEPCKDDGVDRCEEGPFPTAGFVAYGDECRYAREVQQDEDHVGQGAGWSDGMLQGIRE